MDILGFKDPQGKGRSVKEITNRFGINLLVQRRLKAGKATQVGGSHHSFPRFQFILF